MAERKRLFNQGLPDDVASSILQNAFQANGMQENSVPLESLVSYSNYRRERFFLQRILAVIMFIVTLLMPLFFLLPNAELSQNSGTEPGHPEYTVSVGRNRWVSGVKAVIDGIGMPVYQTDDTTYLVRPVQNGTMMVTVRLFNDQSDEFVLEVTEVDREAPTLVDSRVEDGRLLLKISDTGTGVDYDRIYAQDSDGNILWPLSYDTGTGQLEYSYPESPINLHLWDRAQNHLQLLISPKPAADRD